MSEIDDALLYHEFLALTGFALFDDVPVLVETHSFVFEDMKKVKEQFLDIYSALKTQKKRGGGTDT